MEALIQFFATGSIVGTLAPFVQALLSKPSWPSNVKVALAVGFSVLLGTVTAATSGQLTGLDWSSAGTWLGAIALVFATSQAAFVAWQKTGAFSAAEQVGAKIITPQTTDIEIPADSEAARLSTLEHRIAELESAAGRHTGDA